MLINEFVLPTFCHCLYFTGLNFRGMLYYVCDVAYDENRCRPIKSCKCRGTNWLRTYLTLLLWCFYCWLLTNKYRLDGLKYHLRFTLSKLHWINLRSCSEFFNYYNAISNFEDEFAILNKEQLLKLVSPGLEPETFRV